MELLVKFLAAAIVSGTPLLFGTLGEILTEKAGHLNLGVEGMMAMGAIAGFYVAYKTNNVLLSLLTAFVAGLLCALIYAFLTITLKATHNVTGLTLTIFGSGLSSFIAFAMIKGAENGVPVLQASFTQSLSDIHIPYLSDIPVIGELLFQYNPLVYLGIVLAIIMAVYMKKTRAGLNLTAVGENPAAADAAGINVTLVKYIHVLIGGGICGLGGAYMSLTIGNGSWVNNVVNGYGWIAVALVIFASWNPAKAIGGAFVFGAFSVIRYYMPSGISLPTAFYNMLPFLVTAIVLVLSSVRKKKKHAEPAAIGAIYFREER